MAETDSASVKRSSNSRQAAQTTGAGGIWFLGFVGALVYYMHFHSGTVWLVLVGIFKAIFWPAYLVYELLKFLNM